MVKLYYLSIIRKEPLKGVILCSHSDFSDFNYFHRKGVKEFMRFSSLVLVGRTDPETNVSVRERTYVCHAYLRSDDLAATAITDDEYPPKIAHVCLMELLSEFSTSIPSSVWKKSEDSLDYPNIKEVFQLFSKPKDLDRFATIRKQLDETEIVLHQTLESVLHRGENLDDLVDKADDLSIQAKAFYKSARKANSCCSAL